MYRFYKIGLLFLLSFLLKSCGASYRGSYRGATSYYTDDYLYDEYFSRRRPVQESIIDVDSDPETGYYSETKYTRKYPNRRYINSSETFGLEERVIIRREPVVETYYYGESEPIVNWDF